MKCRAAAIMLPVELLHKIAGMSLDCYRAMLALPQFVRSLDPGIIADYKILFGHSINITRKSITWTRRGRKHRLDGPAVERLDTSKSWWVRGKLHREGGLAVDRGDGTLEWWCQGGRHREDGPATVFGDGHRAWWHRGRRHRLDGPAVILPGGGEQWYENGVVKNI